MAKTAWSLQAIDDLSAIEDYLALSSKRYATLTVDAFIAYSENQGKGSKTNR